MSKKQEEFILIMAAFVRCTLQTLGAEFAREHLKGRSLNRAATELLRSIIEPVRGNRGADAAFLPEDYGHIMDAVARFHLKMRPPEIVAAIVAELNEQST